MNYHEPSLPDVYHWFVICYEAIISFFDYLYSILLYAVTLKSTVNVKKTFSLTVCGCDLSQNIKNCLLNCDEDKSESFAALVRGNPPL